MTERDNQIIELARKGLSARKIRERLNLDITSRAINRIVLKHLGPRPDVSNSHDNQIPIVMMPLIKECLRRLSKDSMTCEICEEPQSKPCEIHHTKYEGATIYDLQYVCKSCNLAFMNRGLS
jgi:hypothetical protein